ncbi:MAG: thiamine pyrophosphate-binding protein, partial [Alphaproteobacteria bacterium]|nr:thiamine pyrophosphate-binding protein [Alphaproteobacteria bacterium]
MPAGNEPWQDPGREEAAGAGDEDRSGIFHCDVALRLRRFARHSTGRSLMAKTSELVVKALIEGGVTHAFTLPGLGITWSLPAFKANAKSLDVVLTRSEWIASVMAQAVGRLTGRPAVAMGQGPWMSTMGAMGILEAHFSGSPMVVLTETSDYDGYGQMGVYQTMTGDYGGADAMAALKPITKYCTYATAPAEAVYGVQMAIKHARLPRMGPAAVIMKTPIIRAEMPDPAKPALHPSPGYHRYTPPRPDAAAIAELARRIAAAERPVVIAGNGVTMTQSGQALQDLALGAGLAVATSYNAKGVVAETAPIAVGMLGTWGHACANRAVAAADLVVMLGASMGPDYTRFRDEKLIRPGEQWLAQIDIDPRNAGWVYPVDLAITADVADAIAALAAHDLGAARRDRRLAAIAATRAATGFDTLPTTRAAQGSVHHADLIHALQGFIGRDDLIALDAGANRIWATFGLRNPHPHQFLVAGGTGAMGWGAPAAAAAKLVLPRRRVTCLAGDGGFMMTLQT